MKRLLPFVLLILILIGGIISVPFLLRPERYRAQITDALTKLFKRPVVIGQISMVWWPPALRLSQVAVMKDGGNPALQMESIQAPLDPSALFHLKFVPTELTVSHGVLTILRKPDGSWDFHDWFTPSAGSGTGAWPLLGVHWTGGEIHWQDSYAAAPQELVLGSLEGNWDIKQGAVTTTGAFSGLNAGTRLTFNARGQFFSSPQWTGDLQLLDGNNSGTIRLEDKADAIDAKGGAPKWSFANALAFAKFYGRSSASGPTSPDLTLDNLQIHATQDAKGLAFETTTGLSGGLSEIKGTMAPEAAGPHVHAEIAAKGIPALALLNAAGLDIPLDGKVTIIAKDVEIVLSTQTLSTVKGQGYWELADGRYKVPEASVKKLAKAKTMAYVKKKFPDLEQAGIPITKFSAHWQAANGIFVIDDGLLVSTDLKAAWVGKIDADRQGLDGTLRLQLHEKNPALAQLIPTKYHTQPAYGRLQGTWQEWFLRSIQPTKIPSAVLAKLRKAIGR